MTGMLRVGITGAFGQLGTAFRTMSYLPAGMRGMVTCVPILADVRYRSDIEAEIKAGNFDIVIHCAALVGTIVCDIADEDAYEVNGGGAHNVAQACREARCRMVYLSTTAIYDPFGVRPYRESAHIAPMTIYGKSKQLGEEASVITLGHDCLTIRPCFVYGGAGDTVSTVFNMIRSHKNRKAFVCQLDPKNKKDWIYISDFIAAAWEVILSEGGWGAAVNIAHGSPIEFAAVLDELRKRGVLPTYAVMRSQDDYLADHIVDTTFLRSLAPQWSPKVSLSEGIDRIIAELFPDGVGG